MARRSVLFTPGDRPEMLRKASDTAADVLVFDLEDAVVPGRRPEARRTVAELLASSEFDPDAEVCVRLTRTEPERDLEGILAGGPGESDATGQGGDRLDAVMLPKVASPEAVDTVAGLLAERNRSVPVFALIETARGVLRADEVADASATDALVFGAEDLAADLGAMRTAEGHEVLYARERVVTAAAAAGIDAIDTLYTDFEDEAGLRDDAAFATQLGYDGKLAIHPAQVAPINHAFTPDPDRVAWARKVLEAREAIDPEDGVFEVDGEMIDAPLIAQAEQIVDRAEAGADDTEVG